MKPKFVFVLRWRSLRKPFVAIIPIRFSHSELIGNLETPIHKLAALKGTQMLIQPNTSFYR
jgi:hypothetical protein